VVAGAKAQFSFHRYGPTKKSCPDTKPTTLRPEQLYPAETSQTL
jgi:hypothetical protein